jgi:hypothetical protein
VSTTAEATHVCEICATPLQYKGGPHMPRWCAEHRTAHHRAYHSAQEALGRRGMAGDPTLCCSGCSARLLRPSEHGYCNFCAVEIGLVTEDQLEAA